MEKDIEFRKLYFRSFKQIEDYYNKMPIGTILKMESITDNKIRIYKGDKTQFAVLDINHKTVKECVDNLLLNPDANVKFENNETILLSTSVCISDYRQEELLLWCMKKKLLIWSNK